MIARGADPAAEVLIVDLVVGFIVSMGLGAAVGIAGGLAIARLVERLNLDQGLLPIFVLTLSLLVFAGAGAIGGSGFLAVYLAGLVVGNSEIRGASILKRFQDGMSWLAQIIMFLVLGLFATPSQFPSILLGSVVLGLFLIFIARPLAVWLCLFPFRFPRAGDRLHLLGRPARRRVDPARHHAAARRARTRPRNLQHRLHHRAGLAGRAGLDGRLAGAPARPDRAGPHRTARKGRARTAGLGASRTARLHGRAGQPGGARRAASRAGRGRRWSCATAARCASRTWAG